MEGVFKSLNITLRQTKEKKSIQLSLWCLCVLTAENQLLRFPPTSQVHAERVSWLSGQKTQKHDHAYIKITFPWRYFMSHGSFPTLSAARRVLWFLSLKAFHTHTHQFGLLLLVLHSGEFTTQRNTHLWTSGYHFYAIFHTQEIT